MTDLLRRAWDALDSFKQAHPESWHEEDEQVLKELMWADLKLSGVQREWVGLTDEEIAKAWAQSKGDILMRLKPFARAIEAKLREKNGG